MVLLGEGQRFEGVGGGGHCHASDMEVVRESPTHPLSDLNRYSLIYALLNG